MSSLFSSNPPFAAFFAEDFTDNTISNHVKNGRDATTTRTITKTTASGNNITTPITYITGMTTSTISFSTGSIPSTSTILSLTRYNSGTRQRKLCSKENKNTANWLHGYWAGIRGIAHYEAFKSGGCNNVLDNWVCVIGENCGSTPYNIIVNGTREGTYTGGSGNYTLGINKNIYSENIYWAFNCIIIWDTALTDAEMLLLDTMIDTQENH
jgi:hypothetical protein